MFSQVIGKLRLKVLAPHAVCPASAKHTRCEHGLGVGPRVAEASFDDWHWRALPNVSRIRLLRNVARAVLIVIYWNSPAVAGKLA
jgi:hypothetical protein